MATVTIRDLRNHGGDVLERVARGEPIVVTRAGKPVAQLQPLARRALSAEELLSRWRPLPALNPGSLAADIDALLDTSL